MQRKEKWGVTKKPLQGQAIRHKATLNRAKHKGARQTKVKQSSCLDHCVLKSAVFGLT